MNKKDFIEKFAANAKSTKIDARKDLNLFVKTIENEIKQGNKVSLKGFGTFFVIEKAARKGVDPQTHKYINIPAHKVVKFAPGKALSNNL